MRRILTSLFVITIVGAVAIGASRASFSDTEISEDNQITAGTIDISVDNNNPWTTPVTIDDLKPSYVRWTKHVVKNVGENPLRLWKRLDNIETFNNGWSEEECSQAQGNWQPPATQGVNGECLDDVGQPVPSIDNIDEHIVYDMYLDGEVTGTDVDHWLGGIHSGGTPVGVEDDGMTLEDIESVYFYLTTLEPDHEVTVWQSYHMRQETGDWAQTDSLNFDIEFYAEQVNGDGPIAGGTGPQTLLLENKDASFNPIIGDGKWGVLKWAGDGPTFDFSTTFKGYGLDPSTAYSLIYYADPWPGAIGALLGAGTTDPAGNLTIAANPNLNMDLPDSADANYPLGAKIWLVLSSDYGPGGDFNGGTSWNPSEYLFEYNLITYDDTDV